MGNTGEIIECGKCGKTYRDVLNDDYKCPFCGYLDKETKIKDEYYDEEPQGEGFKIGFGPTIKYDDEDEWEYL